jgi:hypothetical protein
MCIFFFLPLSVRPLCNVTVINQVLLYLGCLFQPFPPKSEAQDSKPTTPSTAKEQFDCCRLVAWGTQKLTDSKLPSFSSSPSTLHLLQCKGRNTQDLTTNSATKNSSKRSVLRAYDCSGSYFEANHNLDQADCAKAAPPALILHTFFVVVAP